MFGINLEAKAVHGRLKEYGEIRNLFHTAFPKDEQFPLWLLRRTAIRKNTDFLAWYDGDLFCGISYTVNNEDFLFVLYLAVKDAIRSKGYGSAILRCLKQRFPNKPLILNIEPPDPDADNCEQRVKRYEFYAKNGFADTKYRLVDNSSTYQILATADHFPAAAYQAAIRQLLPGFYAPGVEKQEE